MNKYYPTKEINYAWLLEMNQNRTMDGIKNIIGIIIEYNNEKLFYSILDDCFFKTLPSSEERINNFEKYANRIFVEVYHIDNPCISPIGVELYKKLEKDFLSKEEIIANRKLIRGYYSDFDYYTYDDNNVDYNNTSAINENIINSVSEYEQKLGRPITYDENHIYGPKKTLKKV